MMAPLELSPSPMNFAIIVEPPTSGPLLADDGGTLLADDGSTLTSD